MPWMVQNGSRGRVGDRVEYPAQFLLAVREVLIGPGQARDGSLVRGGDRCRRSHRNRVARAPQRPLVRGPQLFTGFEPEFVDQPPVHPAIDLAGVVPAAERGQRLDEQGGTALA